MPRNSSGSYTLPAGNPVTSGTTISTAWANSTLSDLSVEISDSASRSGKGNFTAPVRVPDGTVAAPAVAFTAEINSGWYRAGAGDIRATIGGVDFITPNGIAFPGSGGFGPVLTSTVSGKSVAVVGNQAAASGAADVQIGCTATRTAGFIAAFQNPINTGNKLLIDFNGLLTLANQAASIQPASLVTGITPDANITASAGAGYWKNAAGEVKLEGLLVNNTGAATSNFVTTAPLPTGFRPTSLRQFTVLAGGVVTLLLIGIDGTIKTNASVANGLGVSLDGTSFLARQ